MHYHNLRNLEVLFFLLKSKVYPCLFLLLDLSLPFHHDILRFYVVHKNYENLLISDTLGRLYEYTNEMM